MKIKQIVFNYTNIYFLLEQFTETRVQVRVGYKRVYNLYVSNNVITNYQLNISALTDLSEETFVKLQNQAKFVELLRLIDEGKQLILIQF